MDYLVQALRESKPGQERRELYRHYLSSSDWAELRKRVIARDRACRLCPSAKHFNVHHRTYKRVGEEDLDDLTLLCRKCHERHHDPDWIPAPKPKKQRKTKKVKPRAKKPKQKKRRQPARSVVLVGELLATSGREWTAEQLTRTLAKEGLRRVHIDAAIGSLNMQNLILRSPHRVARWRWAGPSPP